MADKFIWEMPELFDLNNNLNLYSNGYDYWFQSIANELLNNCRLINIKSGKSYQIESIGIHYQSQNHLDPYIYYLEEQTTTNNWLVYNSNNIKTLDVTFGIKKLNVYASFTIRSIRDEINNSLINGPYAIFDEFFNNISPNELNNTDIRSSQIQIQKIKNVNFSSPIISLPRFYVNYDVKFSIENKFQFAFCNYFFTKNIQETIFPISRYNNINKVLAIKFFIESNHTLLKKLDPLLNIDDVIKKYLSIPHEKLSHSNKTILDIWLNKDDDIEVISLYKTWLLQNKFIYNS